MPSIGEQILARAQAVLVAAATPAGERVFRTWEIGLTRAEAPSITVRPKDEPSQAFGQFTDRSDLEVEFEIYARGEPWDTQADTVYVPLHTVITTDAQLKSLCSDIRRIHRSFEGQEADLTAGMLTVTYRFVFLSCATDVSVGPKP